MEMYCGWHKYTEIGQAGTRDYYKNDMGVDWYVFLEQYVNATGKFFFLKGRNSTRLAGCTTNIVGLLPVDYWHEYVDLYIFDESEVSQDFINAYYDLSHQIVIEDWDINFSVGASMFKFDKFMEHVNSEIAQANTVITAWTYYIEGLNAAANSVNKVDPDYSILPPRPLY